MYTYTIYRLNDDFTMASWMKKDAPGWSPAAALEWLVGVYDARGEILEAGVYLVVPLGDDPTPWESTGAGGRMLFRWVAPETIPGRVEAFA